MMRCFRRAATVTGVWTLCLLAGCGTFFVYPGSSNGGGGSGSGDNVYVANSTNQTVAGFTVGTGTLTAITGTPVNLGFTPTALAVNPANSLLFVASISGIYSYSIGSNGALSTDNSGVTSGVVTNVVSMDVSPDGQWLFALNGAAVANVLTVYQFKISSNGALSATTSSGASYTGTYNITAPSGAAAPVPYAIKAASVTSGVDVFVALGTGGRPGDSVQHGQRFAADSIAVPAAKWAVELYV